MANKNRGRGTPRGDFRGGGGRGGRGGRGGFRGRGARGGPPQPSFGAGRGRGRGGYHTLSEMGDVYLMAEEHQQQPYSGTSTPRERGSRGGFNSNRGSGRQTPSRGGFRGRGRGIVDDFLSPSKRGHGGIGDRSPRGRNRFKGDKLRSDAPLSDLLHQERPLLRPVIFVRSTLTATLFEEEEELLKATIEEIGDDEKSHVPTADRVFRLFSAGNIPPISDSEDEEQLEEIDFNETEKLLQPTTSTSEHKKNKDVEIIEERFTGIFINRDSPPSTNIVDQESTTLSAGGVTTTTSATIVVETTEPVPAALPIGSSVLEEPMNVDPIQETPEPGPSTSTASSTGAEAFAPPEESVGFYIDTEPTKIEDLPPPPVISSDDEEIVYVAPHPRSERDTPAAQPSPAPQVSALPTTSIITGTTITSTTIVEETEPVPQAEPPAVPTPPSFSSLSFSFQPTPQRPRQIPTFTAGSRSKAALKQRQRDARAARTKAGRKAMFGMFGGMMAEAQLQEELKGRDPKWEERRRGDSDIDWGDDDDGEGGKGPVGAKEGLEGDAEGMLVDEDINIEAMKMFVKGMNPEGSTFVTMDDIADQEMMRKEDEEEDGENGGQGSSAEEDDEEEDKEGAESDDEESEDEGDVDAVVNAEEELMIAEEAVFDGLMDDDEEDEEEDSDDDIGLSPGASFQARLERLREQSRKTPSKSAKKGKGKARMEVDDYSDDDDDDEFLLNQSWAEQDEEFMAHIQDILDENEAALTGRDRKARKQLFNAIRDGDFDDMDDFKPARKKKDKYKDLPIELQAQWKKDREKKAEYKLARELAKLEAAADPLVRKKGGKKGRKAMLAAAMADPTIVVLPNRIIDMTTLVQQIRRFTADVGGPQSMPLPPTNKQTRKAIHEMAIAFNLKSKSEGKGNSRYTTLKKTSRSHFPPDERKIASIVKRFNRGGGEFISGAEWASKRGDRPPKHKEGDEVGKHAPKIGEANIGFKMLSLMGWSEGDRIGVSGGLEAPITALFKTSKLGLGATR